MILKRSTSAASASRRSSTRRAGCKEEAQALLAEYQTQAAARPSARRQASRRRQGRGRAAGRRGARPRWRISSRAAPRWRGDQDRPGRGAGARRCPRRRRRRRGRRRREILARTVKGKVADDLIAEGHRRSQGQAQLRSRRATTPSLAPRGSGDDGEFLRPHGASVRDARLSVWARLAFLSFARRRSSNPI